MLINYFQHVHLLNKKYSLRYSYHLQQLSLATKADVVIEDIPSSRQRCLALATYGLYDTVVFITNHIMIMGR